MIHARKIVTVIADDHAFRLDIAGDTVATVPHTISSEIHRYKAYATQRADSDGTAASRRLLPLGIIHRRGSSAREL
jgi:hypothetical protein